MIWKLSGILALCFLSYLLGYSQSKVKVIEKQVESIRYIEQERAEIQAKPNKTKNELLDLMRKGQL